MKRGKHSAARRARRGVITAVTVVGCSLALALGCMGFSFATAHDSDATINTFGIRHTSAESTTFTASEPNDFAPTETNGLQLTSAAPRDNSQGINEIIAEENSAERKAIEQANAHRDAYLQTYGALPAGDVDFSIGQEAFIATWTERINNYLAGFPLAGHGEDFARAAWEYGVDPRWSPAISNTESTRGSVCFLPYNAWGWGASSWSSWSEAINDHVKGLAEGYAFTIAYSLAQKYCPPNCDNWYRDTLGEMQKI